MKNWRHKLVSYLKAGFKTKIVTASAVVIFATFFNAFPIPILMWITGIAFLVTAEIFVFIYVHNFLSSLPFLFGKTQWASLPKDYDELTKKINVKIKFGVRENLDNVFCQPFRKAVVVGKNFMRKLNSEQQLAVLAHECAHIKKKHHLKSMIFLTLSLFFFLPLLELPIVMSAIALLAYIFVSSVPISWRNEFEADRIAAEFVGKETVISTLLAISTEKNRDETSESHPSITKRIKKLKTY